MSKKGAYGAAHGGHGVLAGEVLAEAEVDHFDAAGVALALEHEVLRLDVSKKALGPRLTCARCCCCGGT